MEGTTMELALDLGGHVGWLRVHWLRHLSEPLTGGAGTARSEQEDIGRFRYVLITARPLLISA